MKLNLRLTLLLVLVASVFVLGWSNQRSGTPTFEYNVIVVNSNEKQMYNAELNQIGGEGWELVSVVSTTYQGTNNQMSYYFKRVKR